MEEKHNLISLPHYGIIRTIFKENEKHHISWLLNDHIFVPLNIDIQMQYSYFRI